MWTPTHVQVTVQRARGLVSKGKNGTNDVFVTIALGKEKYQTSVKTQASDPVEWHEECELPIPKQGNKAEVVLTALHRNFIGDEFLGQAIIPLSDFDVYDKPKNKWYVLKSKPGKEKKKERGDLEVKISFTVRSGAASAGSLSDLTKKDGLRNSFVGGSLLSLRGKEKKGSLKNLAKVVGNKVSTLPGRGKKKPKDDQFGTIPEQQVYSGRKQQQNDVDADPGVVSDEDEFRFDELSHKSSHSSLSASQVSSPKDGSLENLGGGEFLRRNNYNTPPPGRPPRTPTTTTAFESNRWSSGPVDEWDAKLFGKQSNVETNKPKSQDGINFSPIINRKVVEEPSIKSEEAKPDANGDGVKALLFAASAVFKDKDKEPVPKPRQVQENRAQDQSKPIIKEIPVEKTPEVEEKKPKSKEKSKGGAKETFSSIFNPQKSKESEDGTNGTKGTPIGITNPIRNLKDNQQEVRIPREALRKYEGKSREDLIEMVLQLQTTVDYQKQKMNDMEDYIDNLIVRVMENKPTLLQSPFAIKSTVRPMK